MTELEDQLRRLAGRRPAPCNCPTTASTRTSSRCSASPRRTSACECERSRKPTWRRACTCSTRREVQGKLSAASGRAACWWPTRRARAEDKIREIYLRVYSREPQSRRSGRGRRPFGEGQGRKAGLRGHSLGVDQHQGIPVQPLTHLKSTWGCSYGVEISPALPAKTPPTSDLRNHAPRFPLGFAEIIDRTIRSSRARPRNVARQQPCRSLQQTITLLPHPGEPTRERIPHTRCALSDGSSPGGVRLGMGRRRSADRDRRREARRAGHLRERRSAGAHEELRRLPQRQEGRELAGARERANGAQRRRRRSGRPSRQERRQPAAQGGRASGRAAHAAGR